MKMRLQIGILALLIICLSCLVLLRTKSIITTEQSETAKTETSVVPAQALTETEEQSNELQQDISQDEKTQPVPDIDINDWKYILVNAITLSMTALLQNFHICPEGKRLIRGPLLSLRKCIMRQ